MVERKGGEKVAFCLTSQIQTKGCLGKEQEEGEI